jgi:hypothetical protein
MGRAAIDSVAFRPTGCYQDHMTTLNITIPDELARDADAAGLLDPDAIETLLREGLRAKSRAGLQVLWGRLDNAALTPEIEAEIVERVRKVRSRRTS